MTRARTDPRHFVFRRLLALTFIVAWASLGSQVLLLVGDHGLLPFERLLRRIAHTESLSLWEFPTLFRFGVSDAALLWGCRLGMLLGVLALVGVGTRLVFFLSVVMYLSYTVACGQFLSFQWDNLLLECGLLAVLVSSRLPAPKAPSRARWSELFHTAGGGSLGVLAFRLLAFKLYFESGLAKYQSPLGDWQDGSAMTFYYETAPIPSPLAWYAHSLPAWYHHLESWATLAFELLCPVLIFSWRRPRLLAALVFTVFQIVNIATANYGFFSYLALWLHVFLLDPEDLRRPWAWLRRRRSPRTLRVAVHGLRAWFCSVERRLSLHAPRAFARLSAGKRVLAVAGLSLYAGVSLQQALLLFVDREATLPGLEQAYETLSPLRVINTYHLFAQITRERIEPTFYVRAGGSLNELSMHYKPGPVDRWPPFVAPHQPRVDFLLWFYGLSYRSTFPTYVRGLLQRLCHEPDSLSPLFVEPLPESPDEARVGFFRYHFTDAEERRKTGAVWRRERLRGYRWLRCKR